MEILGVHLVQTFAHIGTPRRSVLARVDAHQRLIEFTEADGNRELVALIDRPVELIVVDAPLAAPDDDGTRDLERLLAWCDINLFPVSRRRMTALHGGLRGVELATQFEAAAADGVWEGSPDHLLRQLMWEHDHPPDAPRVPLIDYRAQWPLVRAPVYRPKAAGRAQPAGLDPAWRLVSSVLDLGGWTPNAAPDDWQAIADAARLDALCCAIIGLRAYGIGGAARKVGDPQRGRIIVPVDANLDERLTLALQRMRAEGHIRI